MRQRLPKVRILWLEEVLVLRLVQDLLQISESDGTFPATGQQLHQIGGFLVVQVVDHLGLGATAAGAAGAASATSAPARLHGQEWINESLSRYDELFQWLIYYLKICSSDLIFFSHFT